MDDDDLLLAEEEALEDEPEAPKDEPQITPLVPANDWVHSGQQLPPNSYLNESTGRYELAVTIDDRKLTIELDGGTAYYPLLRRWVQNNPEGEKAGPARRAYNNLPRPGPRLKASQLEPPPRPSVSSEDDFIHAIKEAEHHPSDIDEMMAAHLRHWTAVKDHEKRMAKLHLARYEERLDVLMKRTANNVDKD